jgi:hypothetical protein
MTSRPPLGGALAHRCSSCGDWDRHHTHTLITRKRHRRLAVTGSCRVYDCDCPLFVAGPSEVYVLYVGGGLDRPGAGQPIDHLIRPGRVEYGEVSCPCAGCRDLYEQRAATVPADEHPVLFGAAR